MNKYKRTCNYCNTSFISSSPYKQYCTKNCKLENFKNKYTFKQCSQCNIDVRVYPNGYNKDCKDIFCSNKCQGEWMKTNTQILQLAERANKMRKNWTLDCIDKAIETRKKNGNIIDWNKAGWKQYWKRCDWLTRKIRKQMLESWDGYDYISGEYIKDNLNLHYSHGNYPTLDHIKPRSQCFKEGLSPYEATKPENLA